MQGKAIVIPTIAAVLASAATTVVLMAVTPASGARSATPITVVSGLSFHTFVSPYRYSVDAGETGKHGVTCPTGQYAISGGYQLAGADGLSVASVTSNYPGTAGDDWWVAVANPRIAASEVGFALDETCLKITTTTVGG